MGANISIWMRNAKIEFWQSEGFHIGHPMHWTLACVSDPCLLNGGNALKFHMGSTIMNELSRKHSDSGVMSITEKLRKKLIILISEQGLNSVF